jgi:hypothetical protein
MGTIMSNLRGEAGSAVAQLDFAAPLRRAAVLVVLALAPAIAAAQAAAPATPIFTEDFSGDPAAPFPPSDKWTISSRLDRKVRPLRVGLVADPIGRTVGRIRVQEGDALDGASEEALLARRYVCDAGGSRASEMEAEAGGAPSERAEIQVKADRASGAGELVKFGETLWYRFSFKVSGDWPRDVPLSGREPCRTVIHQIKQNASKDGKDCGASPFFKIEARPFGEHVLFFAQVAAGDSCALPPPVRRTRICVNDLPRETSNTVSVQIFPAQDASGRVDLWLNGAHCGSYRGPMGDAEHGARRNGVPFVDTQPRFGIYRDWRAETQTIYFDKIMFWNAEPTGHPDWSAGPTPQ